MLFSNNFIINSVFFLILDIDIINAYISKRNKDAISFVFCSSLSRASLFRLGI